MPLGELVFFRDQEIAMDLIMLNILDFDIILGIDFLSHYRGKIDCTKMNVQFQLNDGKKFTIEKGHVFSMMINSVKVRKMLSMGSKRYLVHVVNKVKELFLSWQNTLIVSKFQYVFLDNLLRLALEKGG